MLKKEKDKYTNRLQKLMREREGRRERERQPEGTKIKCRGEIRIIKKCEISWRQRKVLKKKDIWGKEAQKYKTQKYRFILKVKDTMSCKMSKNNFPSLF